MPSSTAPLLTFQDAAARCAVSIWTVRGWVDAGRLKVIRLPGRLVRIDPAELDRFIEGVSVKAGRQLNLCGNDGGIRKDGRPCRRTRTRRR